MKHPLIELGGAFCKIRKLKSYTYIEIRVASSVDNNAFEPAASIVLSLSEEDLAAFIQELQKEGQLT